MGWLYRDAGLAWGVDVMASSRDVSWLATLAGHPRQGSQVTAPLPPFQPTTTPLDP